MIKIIILIILILSAISLGFLELNSKNIIDININNTIIKTPIKEIDIPEIKKSITIVIDPGHGPWVNKDMEPIAPDSTQMKRKYGVGTTGIVTGSLEREINLNVSLMLRDLLEKDGYIVIMTRTNHGVISSNIDRANLANDNNADMMIRIHADSFNDSSLHGASMLVPGEVGYAVDIVDESILYGEIILNTLVEEVGMANRGLIERTDQTGFNWSKVPIMTVEMGFLSNPDEDKLLSTNDYQEKIAYGLYLGITKCFKSE